MKTPMKNKSNENQQGSSKGNQGAFPIAEARCLIKLTINRPQ
jgi:hypothetical protein